jgi:hypothetical protein
VQSPLCTRSASFDMLVHARVNRLGESPPAGMGKGSPRPFQPPRRDGEASENQGAQRLPIVTVSISGTDPEWARWLPISWLAHWAMTGEIILVIVDPPLRNSFVPGSARP